jgi:hypothetical protein
VNVADPTSEFQFDVWPCPPPSFSGSWARPRQHNSNRLMLVLSAGWSFRESVAAPSERLLDAARAELFSVSPERACGLSPSRCRHDILMDRPLHRITPPQWPPQWRCQFAPGSLPSRPGMYQAELKGKLPPSASDREDLLTSNVFSFLKYADRTAYLGEFLLRVAQLDIPPQPAPRRFLPILALPRRRHTTRCCDRDRNALPPG